MASRAPAKVLILNPPSPDRHYVNRDLMGGMGVHNRPNGRSILGRLLFKIKGSTIHIPMMQLVNGATLLKRAGFEVRAVDAVNLDMTLASTLAEVKAFAPDYVLMGVSSSCFLFERDQVARSIKEISPRCKTIAVGDMVTELPELLLPWFDFAVMGEVEQSIVQLCRGEAPERIPSILWNESGTVRSSSGGKSFIPAEELEKLPLPDWSLFPYESYTYYPLVSKAPVALIQASRGCPYGCGYCPYPSNQGKKWRARSAESVFEEMVWDIEQFGFKAFFFRDPLFTASQERVSRLCDLIIERKLDIEFVFETRPELLTLPGLIAKLAQAGCRTINFGVEDIHPDVLKRIHRVPVDRERIKATIRSCEAHGIRTSCFYVLGLPGATRETTAETTRFGRQLFSSYAEFKVATPYPGTSLHAMAKANGWITQEGFDRLGGYSAAMRVSEELDGEYLERMAEKSVVSFYFNPRYLWRHYRRGEAFLTFGMMLRRLGSNALVFRAGSRLPRLIGPDPAHPSHKHQPAPSA